MRKTALYAKAGVKEYWVVTPWPSLVEVFLLAGDAYILHAGYGKDEELSSPTFPGLRIALRDVFDFPLEPDEQPRVVRESPYPYPHR